MKRGDNNFPKNEDGTMDYGEIIDPLDTYLAMQECVRLGLARHIGISNFNHEQVNLVVVVVVVVVLFVFLLYFFVFYVFLLFCC